MMCKTDSWLFGGCLTQCRETEDESFCSETASSVTLPQIMRANQFLKNKIKKASSSYRVTSEVETAPQISRVCAPKSRLAKVVQLLDENPVARMRVPNISHFFRDGTAGQL